MKDSRPFSEINVTVRGGAWAFGDYVLDVPERRLTRGGAEIDLTPKAFDLLVALVERGGSLLSKAELMGRLWPDAVVEEGTLARHVSALRKALVEADGGESLVQTVHKSGYRFLGEVRALPRAAEREPPGARPLSLAVLPLKPVGTTDGFLETGMADTLIARLSPLPDLQVRPLGSVLRYANPHQDPLQAGRSLKVDAVLDGTLRREGPRLRVTLYLYRVRDGQVLWAQTFEETVESILAVEDRVAAQVAAALLPRLSAGAGASLSRRETPGPAAYQAYLKGRGFWGRRTPEALEKAVRCFEEAVDLDPSFAAAHAARADALTLLAGYAIPPEAYATARTSAERALSLDAGLADAHVVRGLIAQKGDRDWARAEGEYRQALQLQPRHITALQRWGELLALRGRFEEGIALLDQARQLDPVSAIVGTDLAKAYFYARRYREAIAECLEVLEIDAGFGRARLYIGLSEILDGRPTVGLAEIRAFARGEQSGYALGLLAFAHGLAGEEAGARELLEQIHRRRQSEYVTPYAFALAHLGLAERESALRALAQVVEGGNDVLPLGASPLFDPLRTDPRFQDLLRRASLVPSRP